MTIEEEMKLKATDAEKCGCGSMKVKVILRTDNTWIINLHGTPEIVDNVIDEDTLLIKCTACGAELHE